MIVAGSPDGAVQRIAVRLELQRLRDGQDTTATKTTNNCEENKFVWPRRQSAIKVQQKTESETKTKRYRQTMQMNKKKRRKTGGLEKKATGGDMGRQLHE